MFKRFISSNQAIRFKNLNVPKYNEIMIPISAMVGVCCSGYYTSSLINTIINNEIKSNKSNRRKNKINMIDFFSLIFYGLPAAFVTFGSGCLLTYSIPITGPLYLYYIYRLKKDEESN